MQKNKGATNCASTVHGLWGRYVSRSTKLNSNILKLVAIFFPALLFVIFALVINWIPSFIEEQRLKSPPLEQRILVMNEALDKFKSDSSIDKEVLIKVFESGIQKEIDAERFIDSILNFLTLIFHSIIGILLVYFASLIIIFQNLFKNKT